MRTNAMDLDDDFGSLRDQNSHLSAKLMAQYDVVALGYLATGTDSWRGGPVRGRVIGTDLSRASESLSQHCPGGATCCIDGGFGKEKRSRDNSAQRW